MDNNFKTVVWFLGCTLVLLVIAITVITIKDGTVPDVLENLAIADLAGLTGILVRSGVSSSVDTVSKRQGQPPAEDGETLF